MPLVSLRVVICLLICSLLIAASRLNSLTENLLSFLTFFICITFSIYLHSTCMDCRSGIDPDDGYIFHPGRQTIRLRGSDSDRPGPEWEERIVRGEPDFSGNQSDFWNEQAYCPDRETSAPESWDPSINIHVRRDSDDRIRPYSRSQSRPHLNILASKDLQDSIDALINIGGNIDRLSRTVFVQPASVDIIACADCSTLTLSERKDVDEPILDGNSPFLLSSEVEEAVNVVEEEKAQNLPEEEVSSGVSVQTSNPSSDNTQSDPEDESSLPPTPPPRSRLNSGMILRVPTENMALQSQASASGLELHSLPLDSGEHTTFRNRLSSLLRKSHAEADPAVFVIDHGNGQSQQRRNTFSVHSIRQSERHKDSTHPPRAPSVQESIQSVS